MEGSTRHEAQPLDPNPDDLFEAENNPFAFSPGQLSKMFNPKSLNAFYALGGLDGSEKTLRVDREKGLSHDEEAPNGNSCIDEVADPVSKLAGNIATVTNRTISKWRSPDAHPGIVEGRLAVGGAGRRSMFDTNKPKASPEPSFFSLFRPKPPNTPPKLFKVRRLDKTCVVSAHDILVGDLLLLEPGDVVSADGILIDGLGIACDESALTGESDLVRKAPGNDVYQALNEPLEEEGLKRTGSKGPFILCGSKVVDGTGTSLVTAVDQNTRSHRGLAPLSEPTPLGESTAHRLRRFGSGLVGNCLALFNALFDIIPSLLCLLDAPAKLEGGAKNVSETTSKIDFEKYCHTFISLVLLILACPNYGSITGSADSRLSFFLVLAVFILQHRRRLKPVLDQILSFCQSVVSDAKNAPSINVGHRRQAHWKSALTLLALLHSTPVIAVAWAPVRALRIASGVTASSAAAAVIPLRTIDGVPSWAWIPDYAVWMVCFAIYLTLQVHHIPRHRDHRRQLYLFLVILLAIHFAIALAQSSPTLIDGFTVFGPMVLMVTTFLVALLFGAIAAMEPQGGDGGTRENTSDTSHHLADIATAAIGMGV